MIARRDDPAEADALKSVHTFGRVPAFFEVEKKPGFVRKPGFFGVKVQKIMLLRCYSACTGVITLLTVTLRAAGSTRS